MTKKAKKVIKRKKQVMAQKKLKTINVRLSSSASQDEPNEKVSSINPVIKPSVSNEIKKIKIKVIGIGGGGGNIVSELSQRVKKATFVAANTDSQALKEVSGRVERFQFGQNLTNGLGTGMNVELGEIAAENDKGKIKKILEGQDLLLFVACLGGGTGSGAAPVFAKISQSLGSLNYGIFTLPFKFEGERKMEIAKAALINLKPMLNAITIIPNERIFQVIEKTTPLEEAFSAINKNLAKSLEGLIETIYQPGLINIDFADLKTIFQGRGKLAYLNTFFLPKKEGISQEEIEKVVNSPLYPYGIKGAKGVLFNIVGGKGLSLEEVSLVSKTISEKANPQAKIIFGIQTGAVVKKAEGQNIIKTTVFATGCTADSCQDFFCKDDENKKHFRVKERKKISRQDTKVKPTAKQNNSKKEKKTEKKGKTDKGKLIVNPPEDKVQDKVQKIEKKQSLSSDNKEESVEISGENPEVKVEVKVRRNGLQIKKEAEQEEKEILEREKFWETPAFLRKRKISD